MRGTVAGAPSFGCPESFNDYNARGGCLGAQAAGALRQAGIPAFAGMTEKGRRRTAYRGSLIRPHERQQDVRRVIGGMVDRLLGDPDLDAMAEARAGIEIAVIAVEAAR